MRFRSSEDLVHSRTEWLGYIPTAWRTKPLRSMYRRMKDTSHPDEQMLSVFREHGVVVKESHGNINKTAEDRSIYQLVHPSWLIANRMKAWQGSVGISSYRGIVSGHYICFAPRHAEDDRYLNWLFRSGVYTRGYALISRGVRIGQAEIDNSMYGAMPVLLPPVAEQRAIADYLDRETAQIDALIGKQERLIEMLRERRGALAERAVVELDWSVPLRSVVHLIQTGPFGSQLASAEYITGGVPVINPSHMVGGRLVPDRRVAVSKEKAGELRRHELVIGDVIMARRGELGRCAVVEADTAGALCGTGSALVRPDGHRLRPHFLALVLNSRATRDALSLQSVGATMDNLNASILAGLRVPMLPVDVQDRVVARVEQEQGRVDALIAKAEQFIALARERRSALITAAVTGHIDVRSAS